ncbi:MAG TPA: O-antigen ligase family protein [Bacillota bacterium]|nr:O-antigen ligase family protein [Bacillota bacterium]
MLLLNNQSNIKSKIIYFLLILFAITLVIKDNIADGIAFLILINWLWLYYTSEKRATIPNYFDKSIHLFFIVFIIALIATFNSYVSLKLQLSAVKALLGFFAPFLIYFMIKSIDLSQQQTKYIILGYGLTVIGLILSKIFTSFATPFSISNRFHILNMHPNDSAAIISIVCIIFLIFSLKEAKKPLIALYIAALVLSLYALIITYSRSCWIGIIAAFAWTYLSKIKFIKKEVLLKKVLPLTIIIIVITFVSVPNLLERFYSMFDLRYSSNESRIVIWKTCLSIFNKLPWLSVGQNKFFGIGIKNFSIVFEQFIPNHYEFVPHAHNNFLHILIEHGILGLIAFTILFISMFIKAFEFNKRFKDSTLPPILINCLLFLFFSGFTDFFFKDKSILYFIMLLFGFLTRQNNELQIQKKD